MSYRCLDPQTFSLFHHCCCHHWRVHRHLIKWSSIRYLEQIEFGIILWDTVSCALSPLVVKTRASGDSFCLRRARISSLVSFETIFLSLKLIIASNKKGLFLWEVHITRLPMSIVVELTFRWDTRSNQRERCRERENQTRARVASGERGECSHTLQRSLLSPAEATVGRRRRA